MKSASGCSGQETGSASNRFYKEHGSSFLFGSELKAILAHPDVKARTDSGGLAEVFGLVQNSGLRGV